MGDETILIASRFSMAVDLLGQLAGDDGATKLARVHGAALPDAVRAALGAIEEVYGAGTQALRNWPEAGRQVRAEIASIRAALEAEGVGPEVRRMAAVLVETIERSGG